VNVTVKGPPGIGKAKLLSEARARVADGKLIVAAGSADELNRVTAGAVLKAPCLRPSRPGWPGSGTADRRKAKSIPLRCRSDPHHSGAQFRASAQVGWQPVTAATRGR
jgi:hypothetical protein